ncbi:MAG: hypothetical protein WAX14_10590 [Rhodococcus sp. (in: high G+C Gram-positive bacteria)]|uniref:hypothetical protein n=1 Tax=Rhodococcus sp. TaxID=1831 RepID=UPI003BB5C0B5
MTEYQFVVDGVLSDRVLGAFPECRENRDEKCSSTTLFVSTDDPTVMRTMLARIDDLGLTLLAMRRLPD